MSVYSVDVHKLNRPTSVKDKARLSLLTELTEAKTIAKTVISTRDRVNQLQASIICSYSGYGVLVST